MLLLPNRSLVFRPSGGTTYYDEDYNTDQTGTFTVSAAGPVFAAENARNKTFTNLGSLTGATKVTSTSNFRDFYPTIITGLTAGNTYDLTVGCSLTKNSASTSCYVKVQWLDSGDTPQGVDDTIYDVATGVATELEVANDTYSFTCNSGAEKARLQIGASNWTGSVVEYYLYQYTFADG